MATPQGPEQIEVDDRRVGVNFIEVLFALVVARTLEPITDYWKITAAGWAHLAVAGVLTIGSWIGYHNSRNRPRYLIKFRRPAWPLAQFALDVALVVVYWLTAISAEGTGSRLGQEQSARPEALLVVVAFLLYCAWDEVGLRIRRHPRFRRLLIENDDPHRRYVTRWSTVAALLVAAWAWVCDPQSTTAVVTADGLLIAVLIGFRYVKDRFDESFEKAQSTDLSAVLAELELGVQRLRRLIRPEDAP